MRSRDYAPRPAVLKWLLESDPSIRWQVMRDLTDASPAEIAAERSRIATEGWGAQLLAAQSSAGYWGDSRKWDLVTLNSLVALKDLGIDPASKLARRAIERIDKHLRFKWHGNRRFFEGEVEPCINGRILGAGAYFGKPNEALAQRLLSEQLDDGGWNCEAPKSTCSSCHTTICVLEGLLEYEQYTGKSKVITRVRKRAEEYLLKRRLFRSLRTGEIVKKSWLRFAYPPFWHYDVLRALDYFRNAKVKPDERIREAIEVVAKRGHQNGRWPLNLLHPEWIPLQMETEVGRASRWNTLRALRVLKWYGE